MTRKEEKKLKEEVPRIIKFMDRSTKQQLEKVLLESIESDFLEYSKKPSKKLKKRITSEILALKNAIDDIETVRIGPERYSGTGHAENEDGRIKPPGKIPDSTGIPASIRAKGGSQDFNK